MVSIALFTAFLLSTAPSDFAWYAIACLLFSPLWNTFFSKPLFFKEEGTVVARAA